MALRDEFLPRNAQTIRFGNLDLASPACTLASPLLPNSPLNPPNKNQSRDDFARTDFVNVHWGNRRVVRLDHSSCIGSRYILAGPAVCCIWSTNFTNSSLNQCAQTPPSLNSGICIEVSMGRFPPMPHTFFQMARRLEVIHLLNSSKQLIHERTEAHKLGERSHNRA